MTKISEELAAKLKLQQDAGIPHLPTDLTYECRLAVNGAGPRAHDWSDKPHRLIYDLCREIERLATSPPPSGEAGEVTDEMVERAARAEYTRVILPTVMPEFRERQLNANWRFYEVEARRWLSGALPTIKEPTDGGR